MTPPSIETRHCAILSMDKLDDFECYDYLLDQPLAERGWQTHTVSWRDTSIDWDQFDVVLIRSPWDYQDDPQQFLNVLRNIDASSARLENPLTLVEWNIEKTYLRDLQRSGITIVPTLWPETFSKEQLAGFFESLSTDELVIKPIVSANADNTFRLTLQQAIDASDTLADIFSQRPFMVQPFMSSIIEEGEFSLFFFAGAYSHAILKTPKAGDFRVQEEHGGRLKKIEPENLLLTLAQQANAVLTPLPLYSRLDFVRTNHSFAIMEIELIEPSLYFNMDADSPQRFARAFDQWISEK